MSGGALLRFRNGWDQLRAARPTRAAQAFIFITVLLDMLALGMIIPVLPKLVEDLVGGDTARAAAIFGVFGTAWALMQFLFSPLLGALSDRFGRRRVILLSNLGMSLDSVLMALAPNVGWLFVGRIISGITAASMATAFAYIADITPEQERAARFGMVGAAFGVGFILGPAIGGVLGALGPRLPFWFAAALSLVNTLYGTLVLPESLSPARQRPFELRRANPVGSLVLLRSHPQLSVLAAVEFLSSLAHAVLPSTAVLYAFYRYGWDERMVGLMLAGVGASSLVVQLGVLRPFVARFGERTALLIGLVFGSLGFGVYGLAPTGLVFCAGIPLMALWGLSGPAVQGLMTRRVDATEQGELQGANASIMGVASLIGPGLFTQTFAHAIEGSRMVDLSGAPFLLAAMLLLAAALIARLASART